MRTAGISYDTGFVLGENSRPDFDLSTVQREMRVIADDLHCNAVRVSGSDPARIEAAARMAVRAGLQVWISPFTADLDAPAMVEVARDCAVRAERVQRDGGDVVLLLGCEISLFGAGLIPGATFPERISALMSGKVDSGLLGAETQACLNEMLGVARPIFGGPISYAAGIWEWEAMNWAAFDLVSLNAYRDADNAGYYEHLLRRERRHGKPVTVTEFGCCTYRGAGDRGGLGWLVGDPTADPPLDGTLHRDESEQVDYFTRSIDAFDRAGIDGGFWFTFAQYSTRRRDDDPCRDTDLVSYGVVAMLPDDAPRDPRYPDMPWQPKSVFDTIARTYGQLRTTVPT